MTLVCLSFVDALGGLVALILLIHTPGVKVEKGRASGLSLLHAVYLIRKTETRGTNLVTL